MSAATDGGAGATDSRASPYKGLVPYTEADADYFFGRDEWREIITDHLLAYRLTVFYGASGVGKSSVLAAGVVHKLRQLARENVAASGRPEVAVVSFGSWSGNPLRGLETAVRESIEAISPTLAQDVPADGRLAETLAAWSEIVGGQLLVILDQFEEYFVYHPRDGEGDGSFADELARALSRRELPANFLISLREDAVAKLDRFEGRVPYLLDNLLRLEHLDRAAGREAIEKPLEQYNRLETNGKPVGIEPALVDEVLEQVQAGRVLVGQAGRGVADADGSDGPDARIEAPYLQLVMERLWRTALDDGSRTLSAATLHRLGGAEKIIRTHLDTAMDELVGDDRDVAADVFHYLVTPSGTKIAHALPDLAAYSGRDQKEVEHLLEQLSAGDRRIVRATAPPGSDARTYEIFHDELAPAVLDWRARYLQRQADQRAEAELREAEDRRQRELREAEERRQRELREAEERRQQQEREAAERTAAARRRVRTLAAVAVVLVVILAATVAAMVYAFRQRQIARAGGLAANARAQLLTDPSGAVDLARQAVEEWENSASVDALRESLFASHLRRVLGDQHALSGRRASVVSAAFSPDGRLAVTAGGDGTAFVWDGRTGRKRASLPAGHGQLSGASFSADGDRIVVAGPGEAASVWTSGGRRIARLRGHASDVTSAAFSADGRFVVTTSKDKTARVWKATGGRPVRALRHRESVYDAAFSRPGDVVATVGGDGVRVWRTRTGDSIARLARPFTEVALPPTANAIAAGAESGSVVWDLRGKLLELDPSAGVEFSPDATRVVTAGIDGVARVSDARTGRPLASLAGHEEGLWDARFSADGELVVTASADGTSQIAVARTGRTLVELRGHQDEINTAEFSPDGRSVITASEDGTARLWATGVSVFRRPYPLYSAALDTRAARVAAVDERGTATVWSATGRTRLYERRVAASALIDVAFARREVFAAGLDDDGRLAAWNVRTGRRVAFRAAPTIARASFGSRAEDLVSVDANRREVVVWRLRGDRATRRFRGLHPDTNDAALSADGQRVVAASVNGTARVWDVTSGKQLALLEAPGAMESAVFSVGGRLVATSHIDKTVRVWDVQTEEEVGALLRHPAKVSAMTFGAVADILITGTRGGTVRVWNPTTGQVLLERRGHAERRAHPGIVSGAGLSADGKRFVTVGYDGTVQIHDCTGCGRVEELLAAARR